MRLFALMKSSTLWIMLPSLALAFMMGSTVMEYDPLTFDPSLYESGQSVSLAPTTAAEKGDGTTSVAGTPADPSSVQTAASISSNKELADGTWTGYAACGKGNPDGWKPYYVAVTVVVKDGKPAGITNVAGTSKADSGAALSWDASENQSYLTWAISGRGSSVGVQSQINSAASKGKTVSGIDTVSGATYSSVAIYNAYVDALGKSAKAAGNSTTKAKKAKKGTKSSSAASGTSQNVSAGDAAKDISGKSLADGEWVGYAACGVGNEDDWKPYYVEVTLQVSGGKVSSIKSVRGTSTGNAGSAELSWDESENQAYLTWALNGRTRSGVTYTGVLSQIQGCLAKGAHPTSVDTVSGATFSSVAILQAYYDALSKSAEAGGATVEVPDVPVQPNEPSSSDEGGDDPNAEGGTGNTGQGDSGSTGGQPESGESGGSGGTGDDGESGDSGDQSGHYELQDGTYQGYALCRDGDDPGAWGAYYVIVEVEVADGAPARIVRAYGDSEGVIDSSVKYSSSENSLYLNWAIDGRGNGYRKKSIVQQIQAKITAGQSAGLGDIQTVSGATWSSRAIIEAYNNAIASAPQVFVPDADSES